MNLRFEIQFSHIVKIDWCFGLMIKSTIIRNGHHTSKIYIKKKNWLYQTYLVLFYTHQNTHTHINIYIYIYIVHILEVLGLSFALFYFVDTSGHILNWTLKKKKMTLSIGKVFNGWIWDLGFNSRMHYVRTKFVLNPE